MWNIVSFPGVKFVFVGCFRFIFTACTISQESLVNRLSRLRPCKSIGRFDWIMWTLSAILGLYAFINGIACSFLCV